MTAGATTGSGFAVPRIRVAVLGAVQTFRDGTEVELERRPQLMLALFLARAGRTVSVAELIDLVWGADPPANAVNMVRRHIGVIRRALEPGLPFRAEGSWLAGVPGGYRFGAGPADCDLLEFRALVERASTTAGPAAVSDWVTALSLWRGPYAHGLAGTPPPPAFAAVDQERAGAALAAAEAARRAGSVTAVLLLVQAVAEENPLDEALAAELIRLLAAAGRMAAATAWYNRTSDTLDEHLGVPPGPALTAAFESLASTATHDAPTAPAAPSPRPAQLPADLWLFTGRRTEMATLTAALDRFSGTGAIAIDGTPGVGKSVLAIHWAHAVAGRFPDGQLFANLRGYAATGEPADPKDVLAGFLHALGVPPEDIPADTQSRADLFRTHTAGRRLLVVLDNARDIDQIRPLMPGAAGSLVLITSRTRFAGLATREGAMLLALDRPDISDAREDLRRRAGAQDTRDEDLDQIVAFCDRLPLAVSIVAARSRGRPGGIPELLADLRASHDSLDAFDDGALGGVRAVFSWSYRQLSPDAARLFRLLPLQTGPEAEVPLLASLAALPRRAVEQLVRELARTRLVSEPMPGRYTQHDLICVYATELSASLDTPAEREQAADRVLDHFTHTLNLMNMRHLKPALRTINGVPLPGVDPEDFPDAPSAVRWLRTELENLWAAVADAFARGRNPWPTVVDAFPAHNRLRRTLELEKPARQALDAAMAAGNRTAEGHLRNELGWLAGLDNRDEESPAQFTRALEIFDDLGVEVEQAAIRLSVAQWRSHLTPPDYAGAAPHFERAVALFRAHDHEFGTLLALGGLGRCRLELGRVAQGTTALTEALELSLRRGDLYQSAAMFWHLGAAGHRADAADFLLMSYRLYSDAGNRYWSMVTGVALAEAYFAAGRRWDAAGAWRRASRDCAAVAEAGQIPPGIRERLARLGEQLGVFADA